MGSFRPNHHGHKIEQMGGRGLEQKQKQRHNEFKMRIEFQRMAHAVTNQRSRACKIRTS